MKKLSLLGMMTLMIGTTLYFLRPGREDSSQARAKLKPQVTKTQELFLGSREASTSLLKSTLSLSTPCDELSKKLDDIDFNLPLEEWIEGLDQKLVAGCREPEFANQVKALQATCLDELSDKECAFNALILRSLLRTRGIEESEDRTQLADLVLREFGRGTPNFEKLAKYSEKLMDLVPEQLSFHKLWAMSKVIHALNQNKSPAELAAEIEGRVHPDVWRDDQMMSLELALKTGFEPQSVETVVREMLSEREDPRLHEFLGWSLWKQERRKEALRELRFALDRNPKDSWLREQYQRASAKGADLDAYQARFSLGIEFDDLFQ